MHWLVYAQAPIIALLFWLFTWTITASFPTLQGKRICLLIAHPDDEAMFFSPVLQSITRPHLRNKVFILCLSTGDADGLGQIRKSELVRSGLHLGITSAEHIVVIEDKRFVDSMSITWKQDDVADVLAHYFAPSSTRSSKNTAPPTALIDTIITFDAQGVSGHPNHISLYHGAKAFLQSLMKQHAGWKNPVTLYTLTSTNLFRKYSSIGDCIATMMLAVFQRKEQGTSPTPILAVSNPFDVLKAQTAMTHAHKSQMRWFRWGWIGMSRYMVINDLRKMKA